MGTRNRRRICYRKFRFNSAFLFRFSSVVSIKTKEEIVILREGGRRLATILKKVADAVAPGISSAELNTLAERLIQDNGDTPAFLGYRGRKDIRSFPATLCVSINDEVVHGVPNEREKFLRDGDIVSLDLGLRHGGLFTDMAVTVPVGEVDAKAKQLMSVTKKALSVGIKAVLDGATTGDIGFVIAHFIQPYGFGIVRSFAGHGVGYAVHEEPLIPNFGKKREGTQLKTGMVIAIEPMLNEGGAEVVLATDGFTLRTKDGSRSAHFEHTVAVTENGAEILTVL